MRDALSDARSGVACAATLAHDGDDAPGDARRGQAAQDEEEKDHGRKSMTW